MASNRLQSRRMPWQYEDFERILEQIRPQIGKRDWAVRLMQRSKKSKTYHKYVNSLVKRACTKSQPYFIVESNGVQILGDWRDRYSRTLAAEPDYEQFTSSVIVKELLRAKGRYFDIGTNMGALCARIAKAADCEALAVEPDLETAQRAAATFALNKLNKVVLFHAAVGDHDGTANFFSAPGRSEASSLSNTIAGDEAVSTAVRLLTLDTLATYQEGRPVSFVKIDVEGFEPAALAGAKSLLVSHRPSVMFEYHWEIAPEQGWSAENLCAVIGSEQDYEFKVLNNDREHPMPPDRSMGSALNILARRI